MEEVVGPDPVDGVRSDKPFDLAAVGEPKTGGIEVPHLGELEGDLLVGSDSVEVPAFDHKGARTDEGGHLGVVEGAAEVPFEDLILALVRVAVAQRGLVGGGILPDPFVEVGRADREAVAVHEWRDPHGRLAPVAESVKGNLVRIDEGL